MKRKSWIKSLLILVLAVLTAVTLAACNPDDDPPPEPPAEKFTATEYFNALWTCAKPIGATAIASNADLSVSLDAQLSLDLVKKSGGQTLQKVDFGFDIQAVLGRTASTKNNTAVKIRIYDPTDTASEIVTFYEFATDVDNVYIDFAGKNVKLPHDLAKVIWVEAFRNDGVALFDKLIDELDNKRFDNGQKSINDYINEITGDFGENWSLNSLIDKVLRMADLNIVDAINNSNIKTFILSIFSVNSAEDLLTDGKFDVLGVLTGEAGKALFKEENLKQVTENGVTTRTAKLSGGLLGTLGPLIKMSSLGSIFAEPNATNKASYGDIILSFTEKESKIQDLTIQAELLGMENTVNKSYVYPKLSLKIDKFRIEGATTANQIQMKAAKGDYKTEIAFSEKLELDARGLSMKEVDGLPFGNISLNGKVFVDVVGTLDIVNKQNNKTKLQVKVDLKNRDQDVKNVLNASFADGKFVVKFAEAMDLGGDFGVTKGFMYDLGDENVATLLQGLIKKAIWKKYPEKDPNYVPPTSNPDAPAENPDSTEDKKPDINKIIGQLVKGISTGLPMITANNDFNVSTANILQTVVDFQEAVDPKEWDTDNRTNAIVKDVVNRANDTTTYTDIATCIDFIKNNWDAVKTALKNIGSFDEFKDFWKNNANFRIVKDATKAILCICAKNVVIAGVDTTTLDQDYNKYHIDHPNDFTVPAGQEGFVNTIIAVLGAQISVHGDFQNNGINASVLVKFTDEATISATSRFTLIDIVTTGENSTFKDLYLENQTEIDAATGEEAADTPKWVILGKKDQQ